MWNAKLHIQNRQRHNLLLHGRPWGPNIPNHHPESPNRATCNVQKCGLTRPQHPRCDQNIPGHHWQERSAHQEAAFHDGVHELFWKMTIWNHILVAFHRFFFSFFHVLVFFKFSPWHHMQGCNMAKILVVLSTGLNSQIFHHSSLTPTCGHWMKLRLLRSSQRTSVSMPRQHLPTESMASLHPQRCCLQRFQPRGCYFRGRISSKPEKFIQISPAA